jgi:hypothetical protein
MTAGFPDAAVRLQSASDRVGARTLEIVTAEDPRFSEHHDEIARLRDTEVFIERLCRSLASADPEFVRAWAEQVVPVYRRRQVPMDDLIRISEALRLAAKSVVAPGERAPIDEAIDAAVKVFHRHRRIAGGGRRRNRLLQLLYKGA